MTVWLLYAVVSVYHGSARSITTFQNEFTNKESCVKVGNELKRRFGAETLCVEVRKEI